MALYAATIFLSAFLLFLVQPVIARQILPWFGGAASVWAVCLVFFQSVVLAGYAYADWTSRRLASRSRSSSMSPGDAPVQADEVREVDLPVAGLLLVVLALR